MGITSVKELGRKNVYELGKPRVLTREFVLVLEDNTLNGNPIVESSLFSVLGFDLGTVHPTYTNNYVVKMTYTENHEGSPYHAHVLVEYSALNANQRLHPTSRATAWEFSASPGQIPALFYYEGSGQGDMRPLTNSAYDYFQGLVTEEAMLAMTASRNFASLPTAWIQAQNFINSTPFAGCPAHSVKVAKVDVSMALEDWGGNGVAYWAAKAELHYRQSGHDLLLPDVGFNYFDGAQKRRAMVFDFQNSEWVATTNPIGLDGSGGQTFGVPAILHRRVNPETNLISIFGEPTALPFGP